MDRNEWQAKLAQRATALAAFEAEHGVETLREAAKLAGQWSALISAAKADCPAGHIRCAGYADDGETECDEICSRGLAVSSGWSEVVHRCGDSDGDWVCPVHADQAELESQCPECSR
ncbi:hypothetical protein KKC87_04310 [Patescibacteria group bacterium]|nr:hypothetical protein [Patescibacteria group bacterium]